MPKSERWSASEQKDGITHTTLQGTRMERIALYASHTVKDIPWMLKTFLSVGFPDVTWSLVVARGIVLDFPEYSRSATKELGIGETC